MPQNGKRGRQDGQMAVDDRAKIAKRGASGPSPPTHIRVRALHRPQGALRPLLDATAVDGKASNKAVVQPRARPSGGWEKSPAGAGAAAVGIEGTRLFRTPDKLAKADKMAQGAGSQRGAARGVSPGRREPSPAERAGSELRGRQESRRAQAERRWCMVFFALLPALFLWIAWLYNVVPDRGCAVAAQAVPVRHTKRGPSASAAPCEHFALTRMQGFVWEHLSATSWVPPMVGEQWREFAASDTGKQVAEMLANFDKIVLWVLRGLPPLLLLNLITRAGHKTRLVGLVC